MPPEDNPADDAPEAAGPQSPAEFALMRLRALLASPVLHLKPTGGGLAHDALLTLDQILVISRADVERLIRDLDPAARPVDGAAIEGKYGRIWCDKKAFRAGEPLFLFRATDPLAPEAIREYGNLCADRGCEPEHVAAAYGHAERIAAWQKANPEAVKKLPD